jgi:hypothetical protein
VDFYLSDITTRMDLAKAWTHAIAENRTVALNNSRSGTCLPYSYLCMRKLFVSNFVTFSYVRKK